MDINEKLYLISEIEKLESVAYAYELVYLYGGKGPETERRAASNFYVILDLIEKLKDYVETLDVNC